MSSIFSPKDLLSNTYNESLDSFDPPDLCLLVFTHDFYNSLKELLGPIEKAPFGAKLAHAGNKTVGIKQCLVGPVAESVDLE